MEIGATAKVHSAIEAECGDLRARLKAIEVETRKLHEHPVFKGEQGFYDQFHEMHEQVQLAVRALEDARMRLGKVCQYAGDGVSIYDKV